MKKILIIDDEKNIRFLLASILTDEGYEILEAGSVAESELLINQRVFDLAIIDISLDDKKKRWNFSIKKNKKIK